MCTAITYSSDSFYFGRTLDVSSTFGENIIICPRNFKISFRHAGVKEGHFAIIGIGTVRDNFPLYYDATNEKGLCAAALNFVESARYNEAKEGVLNLAHFEVILYLLSVCQSVSEVMRVLPTLNITNERFSDALPLAKLHWLLADRDSSIVLESTENGLKWHENIYGVLTNEPPFPAQCEILKSKEADGFSLESSARFIHANKAKQSAKDGDGISSVSRFFHIMERVSQIGSGEEERTAYTSCADAQNGIYYYTTYGCRSICAANMHREGLCERTLSVYPLRQKENIIMQN